MAKLILVCGPTGAGKTTYSIAMAKTHNAVKFSIDPWMQTLYAKDMVELDYHWMIERVERCYQQIWQVSEQILKLGNAVVLDLGFTTKAQRGVFIELANTLAINAEVHYLNAPTALRLQRVKQRNEVKDPAVYSFDVTNEMFNFMEPRFEIPDESELKYGVTVDS